MNRTDDKALENENEILRKQVSQLLEHIEDLQRERDTLKETLAKLQRLQFGRKSEKVDPSQLMLDLEDEAREAEEVALPKHQFVGEAPDAEEGPEKKKKKTNHRGRNPLPDHLPRQRIEIHPDPQDRTCSCCNEPMAAIGEDVTEELGRIPARFFVRQYIRVRYACPKCQDGVVRPDLPVRAIEKGRAGEDVLADVLVSKYGDHLPLHRQSKIYKREGVDLSRATLCQWVADCSDLLSPIVEQMRQDILTSWVIQSDDTPIKYQDTEARRASKRGYLWSYVGDKGDVVYQFSTTRGQSVPTGFLTGFVNGVLQVDGYAGYNEILSREEIVYQGCWAHARRKFFDARDTAPHEGAMVMLMIKVLYQVEEEAQEQKLKAADVVALRLEKSQPMLEKLKEYLLDLQQRPVLPQSPLGKAVAYTLNRWDALCLYITDGRLVIDNNSCEQTMRRVAVGRKNWLFAGSVAGGHRAAVIYSLIETCDRLSINPHEYLTDVLRRVTTHPNRRIAELTPHKWRARNAAEKTLPEKETTTTEVQAS